MASQTSDRLLWLCLGVTLFFAVRGITAELYHVRELSEIRKGEKENQVIGEATEDALKLDTLLKLSESSSFDLRAAALRIVSERATKGPTRDLLLEDLSSRNPNRRYKALNALHFLVSSRALARSTASSRLKDLATFNSLVDCLCNFLAEHTEETGTTISPILPRTRPLGENKALATLNALLSENVSAALEAGIVRRWLAKYPFPCSIQDSSKRRNVVLYMKTWAADDPLMSSIVGTLAINHEGVKQLRRYGLMGSRMEENKADMFTSVNGQDEYRTYMNPDYAEDDDDDDDDSDSDVWMLDGEDTAGAQPWTGRRPQEGTAEDQALRRRRREAMVFSEGGRPLGRENIIEPIRHDSVDEGLEDSDEILEREHEDSEPLQRSENDTFPQQGQRRSWLWPFS